MHPIDMSVRGTTHRERGSALAAALLILFILAAIMLYISTSTMSSMFQSKRKQERATGMAAADSAVERIRVALNSNVMDESDGYSLTEADLKSLMADHDAVVMPNAQSSDLWGMSKVHVPLAEAFTVQEKADEGFSYWQIVKVHEPRYHSSLPSDLVIYIRAWATQKGTITSGGTNITTQPRMFRVEFRPGYFSDYQAISDGPFFTQPSNPTWTLNGPIHTNGFKGDEWITETKSGFDMRAKANCGGRVRLTASQGAPMSALGECDKYAGSNKARQINLLNVDKTLAYMRDRCDAPHGVRCFFSNSQFKKTYNVQLSNEGVRVDGELVRLEQNTRCVTSPSSDCGDELMAAVLVDGDINLSGTVTGGNRAARVTIATMRQDQTDQPSRIWLEPSVGTIGAGNPAVDTVGLISQGDIIMGIRPGQCGTAVNVAAIAQSGSVTMPRELVTVAAPNVPSLAAYLCPRMDLTGSFSMHGALISNMSWALQGMAGYRELGFAYQPSLFDNPPPFFARSYPWAMTKTKDADRRCLDDPKEVGNPRCE